MSSGRIIQIIGAVIDVEFERNSVPKIYDALQVDGTETTLEVQQQLGDGVLTGRKRQSIVTDAAAQGMPPGEQRRAGGRAHRRVRIPVGEHRSAGRELVDVRRLQIPGAEVAQVGNAEVVEQNHDNVRLRGLPLLLGGQWQRPRRGKKCSTCHDAPILE